MSGLYVVSGLLFVSWMFAIGYLAGRASCADDVCRARGHTAGRYERGDLVCIDYEKMLP